MAKNTYAVRGTSDMSDMMTFTNKRKALNYARDTAVLLGRVLDVYRRPEHISAKWLEPARPVSERIATYYPN